ncbi:MAG: hypothetical protein RIB45_14620 [Marivibrio sp.]|uniref:hypothetical protein n=1 Tax=Marivibrio sp. TaxID=2039719 RepID=UPI0032EC28DC
MKRTYFIGLSLAPAFRALGEFADEQLAPSLLPPSASLPAPGLVGVVEGFERHGSRSPARFKQAAQELRRKGALCSFWPCVEADAFAHIGCKVLSAPSELFQKLDNKFSQIQVLEDAGDDTLKRHFAGRCDVFEPEVVPNTPARLLEAIGRRGACVATSLFSVGGYGVHLLTSATGPNFVKNWPSGPFVRLETYRPMISATQLAVCFTNAVVPFEPQIQYVVEYEGRLRYAGATSWSPRLSKSACSEMNSLMHSVGAALQGLGYRGAFGCDFVIDPVDHRVFFMELNARFVGETHFLSLCAAHSCLAGRTIADRIMLDPIFLHVWSHQFADPPEVAMDLASPAARGAVGFDLARDGPAYTTLLLVRNLPTLFGAKGDATDAGPSMLLLDADPAETLVAPVRFPSPYAEATGLSRF